MLSGGKQEVDLQNSNNLEIDEAEKFAVAEHNDREVCGSIMQVSVLRGCVGYDGRRRLRSCLGFLVVESMYRLANFHAFVVLGKSLRVLIYGDMFY